MTNIMYAGEQRQIAVLVTKADGSGPLALTGYTMIWEAKPHAWTPDSDPRTIVKTTSNGGITPDPDQTANAGKALVNLVPTDTVGVVGEYQMGLKLFPGSIEVDDTTLTIVRPVVQTTTAP